MTSYDLDRRSARLARSLGPWVKRAGERIEAVLETASAHASKAVTDTLKRMPDGRPTYRRVGMSPSYNAALSRLDELLEWLAGPSSSSLEGFVRDFREAMYRESFASWKPFIPVEYRVTAEPGPTSANVRSARGMVLRTGELRTELAGAFGAVKRSLRAALAVAGRRAATDARAADVLETWAAKSRSSLTRSVTRIMSDSQMEADTRAGRDMVHPDHLDDRPIEVGK